MYSSFPVKVTDESPTGGRVGRFVGFCVTGLDGDAVARDVVGLGGEAVALEVVGLCVTGF